MGSRQTAARDAVMVAVYKSHRDREIVNAYALVFQDIDQHGEWMAHKRGIFKMALEEPMDAATKRFEVSKAELSAAILVARELGLKQVMGVRIDVIEAEIAP